MHRGKDTPHQPDIVRIDERWIDLSSLTYWWRWVSLHPSSFKLCAIGDGDGESEEVIRFCGLIADHQSG